MPYSAGDTTTKRLVFRGGGELEGWAYVYDDAAIKALPTTALLVLPAPGAGFVWEVLSCLVAVDTSGGAYTNVDAAAQLNLDTYGSDYVGNDAALGFGDLDSLLKDTAGHQLVHLRGRYSSEIDGSGALATYQATGWGVRQMVVGAFSGAANAAVYLVLTNGASGNLTGGNAANKLRVQTLAMRVPVPSGW